MKNYISIILCGWTVALVGCASFGPHARQGGLTGGLAGSALGALAGAPTDKAVEGAAIGLVAGSALGTSIGDSIDQEIAADEARQVAYVQEQQRQAVTVADVIGMQSSGLSDEVMANQIRSGGVLDRLSTQDLVTLKSNGVSDYVIGEMQKAPIAGAQPRFVRPPVIVEPRLVPCNPFIDDCYYPPPPCRPRPRNRAGFYMRF